MFRIFAAGPFIGVLLMSTDAAGQLELGPLALTRIKCQEGSFLIRLAMNADSSARL